MLWQPLRPGRFELSPEEPHADPAWIWADATGYRDHLDDSGRVPTGVWCVVETAAGQFETRRFTPASWRSLRHRLRRAELALPVRPERMPQRGPSPRLEADDTTPSAADTLVGVIDSGCPFAAPMLRDARGTGTRVLAIWDQDDDSPLKGRGARHSPIGLGYGAVADRTLLNQFIAQSALPSSGLIDEARAYRLAGDDGLRRRFSHGAAVLSQLFAPPVLGGAFQLRPGEPPSWDRPNTRAIDQADLVFVQPPRAGLQDSTSAALARHVLDGLDYIAAHVSRGTRRVVVNISSGTSRTLHDGSSLLERAMASWVTQVERKINGPVHVVLPAGNTNLEQRHAVLSRPAKPVALFIPPACEMPQYVTLRWPPGAVGVDLRLTAPGGQTVTVGEGQAMGLGAADQQPRAGVVRGRPSAGDAATKGLIVIGPTTSDDPSRVRAPAGLWTIELVFTDSAYLPGPVHCWISRNQRNPGALPRGRQADFADLGAEHQPRRWLRLDEGDDSAVTHGIRRAGAISGMATVPDHEGRLQVVGGLSNEATGWRPSAYSAMGPAAGDAPNRRRQVDALMPADAGRWMPGQTVRANLSGGVVRVIGTSFASPLAARALVNEPALPTAPGTHA